MPVHSTGLVSLISRLECPLLLDTLVISGLLGLVEATLLLVILMDWLVLLLRTDSLLLLSHTGDDFLHLRYMYLGLLGSLLLHCHLLVGHFLLLLVIRTL